MPIGLNDLANVLKKGYSATVEKAFTRLVDTSEAEIESFFQYLQTIPGAVDFGAYDNTEGQGGDKAARFLVKYATGNTVTAYGPGDKRPSGGVPLWRQAELDWRSVWTSVGMTGRALRAALAAQTWDNMDKWNEHMEDALDDIFDELDRQLVLADGTGQSNKEMHGLANIAVQTGSVYGIDMGTYAWWKPVYKNLSGAEPTIDDFDYITKTCKARGFMFDAIVVSEFRAQKLRQLRTAAERNPGDLSSPLLSYRGKPIFALQRIPDDKIFFFRNKHHRCRIQRWPEDPTGLQSSTNHRGLPFGLIPNDDGSDGIGLTLALEGNYVYKNMYEFAYMDNAPTS